jgi:hypothetical protein
MQEDAARLFAAAPDKLSVKSSSYLIRQACGKNRIFQANKRRLTACTSSDGREEKADLQPKIA